MKILVPTDFSQLSKIALNYAIEMAKKLNAELLLLHNVYLDTHARSMAALKSERILEAMVENAGIDFKQLVEDINREHADCPKISTHIIRNDRVEDAVSTFSNEHEIDYIVLGTKGASGIKKVMMGSNAVSVIKKCSKPVITVPEHARFKNIKNLVYSSDLQDISRELGAMISFAEVFNSHIHIVHVDNQGKLNAEAALKLEQQLKEACLYPLVTIKTFQNVSISGALDTYIDDISADMLAMFTHKTTFFDSVFGKSVTHEMAFHNRIPLLSIKK